jgi:hypothetical protein
MEPHRAPTVWINAGLADPKLKARFAELRVTVIPGSPADFDKLIAEGIVPVNPGNTPAAVALWSAEIELCGW